MKVIPVHFSRDSRQMLSHTKMLLERGEILIHPKFDKQTDYGAEDRI